MSCPRTLPPARARRWRARLAGAVAVLVATSGAVATTSAPATAASLSGNPLAGAAGFTVVSYGDAELSNHEIEGSVAVGGNVSVRTGQGPYNLIHRAAGNGDYVLPTLGGTPVRLVVGGFDRASSTQSVRVASGGYTDAATQLGRMTIGSTTGVGIAGRGAGVCVQASTTTDCSGPVIEQSAAPQTVAWTVQPTAFDTLVPTAARDTMAQWSQGIAEGRLVGAEAVTLGSTAQPMNGVDVTLVAGKVNVLRVAAADFPSTDWKLRFPTVKPSATTPLVIDVVAADGASVLLPMETIGAYDAPGGSSDNNFARYMLWNIDQAPGSTVYLSGNGIVPGSLLAPSSTVITGLSGPSDTSADKTLIEGQIVAASLLLRNSGEVHHYGYAASLEIGGGEGGFSLRKALSGIAAGDLPDGTSTQFSVDYFLDGATTKAGTLTLTADGTLVAGPQDLPVGTEVTFREATPSAPTGTVWTGVTFSPSTVEIADGDDVEVTVTNSYRAAVGGFRVAKALSGLTAADLPDGDDTEFAVDYFLDGSTTKAGTLVVTADGTPVAGPTSLPLGTVVTFGEPSAVAPTGRVWTGATISPSSVTITADGQSTLVTVTNSYRDAVGGFSLSKALDGIDAVDLPDGGATEFEVDYFLNGSTTKAGTLTVTADGAVVGGPQNLPLGTVVTFAEPTAVAPSGMVWTGAAFSPSSVTISADGQNTSVTVTNSYSAAVGGFSLAKALDGIDAVDLPDGGATEFEVDYFLNGSTTKAGTLTVTADGVVVAGPQNLPLGTVVTFAEPTAVAPSGMVWTGAAFSPSSVTISADGQNTSVTVTNSYSVAVGGFSLAKALDGIDAVDLPDGGATEFEVDYFLNGSTTKAGTLTVTADGAVVGGPQNLPLGTVVTFAEPTAVAPSGMVWTGAAFSPSSVTISADGQNTSVTVTNSYSAAVGGFSLAKALDGIDAVDLPDGGATEFEVDYFLNGSTTKAGTLTVTADGAVVGGPQNLPLGTVVTFAEPTAVAPSGMVWTGAAFSPSSVTISADGQNTSVTVTNSYSAAVGGFSLAKALDGIDAVDLPDGGATEFEVDYFLNGSTTKAGTLTVTADGAVVGGPTNLPLGTVVTFDEVTPARVAGGDWVAAAFAPATVEITADGQLTRVTLTNTFDADDPTGPGTGGGGDDGGDDDGGDDGTAPRGDDDGGGDSSAPGAGDGSGDEGGALATTGADAWTTLGVALTLALTGAVLLVLRRRETATAARHGLRRP